MIDKLDEKYCTGCFACLQKCPKNCIIVGKDKDGFLKPEIDHEKCIGCNICEKVCPQINNLELFDSIEAYAMKSKQYIINSTSAGIFALLAKSILEKNGVVFGVKLLEERTAKTVYINRVESLKDLQGSKYVQSYTGECYKEVEKFLKNGIMVLFSGTPCQIAGLKKYLNKEYTNLITVDLVCHGVPSQELFDRFCEWLENKNKQKLLEWRFRAKEAEGWAQVDHLIYENKEYYRNEYLNPYTYHFLKGDILRESCYNCNYSQQKRTGDITLGDYWGIRKFHPDFVSNEGVSLVLANTDKGVQLLNDITADVIKISSDIKNMQVYNGGLVRKAIRPSEREGIYEDFHKLSFDAFLKKRMGIPFNFKLIVKAAIPYKIRKSIIRILNR